MDKHYQQKTIIYITQEFYQNILSNQFLAHPIWIRNIIQEPNLQDNRP